MSAIVTDQFRISNASNFVKSIEDSSNSYYVFVGLVNSSPATVGFGRTNNWDTTGTPNPTDSIDYLNHYKSTILFGKKITSNNVRRAIRRIDWVSGIKYEMYRPDYNATDPSPITGSMRLYDAKYYVVNSDYRVYICIDNGSSGSNPTGNTSQVEPTFTDLEPTKLSDGYVWKYLYSISPSDIVKFDSTEYITLPNNWETSTDAQILAVRENGNSDLNNNQIKKVYIQNQGLNYNSGSYNLVGDGSGGTVSVVVDNTTKISDVIVTSGGKNYTYAIVDLQTTSNSGISTYAELIPIIPPSKGHGYDLYKELGADRVLIYVRFDDSTKDFPIDSKFAQVGIIKNPTQYDATGINTTIYSDPEFSGVYSVLLSQITGNITVGDIIQQTQANNKIARGYVISYDQETKVLKYSRDRSLYYSNKLDHTDSSDVISNYFTSSGSLVEFSSPYIINGSGFSSWSATINPVSTATTSVGTKVVNLGVEFTNGLATPEINNKSGEIIYIDNRPTVTRNSRQKEDIKIILEF